MARKEFTGAAAPLVLQANINAAATSIPTTGTVTGWPTGAANPFVIELDRGEDGLAEKVLIESRTGNTLTVAGGGRGYDGTTAQAHTAGARVEHVIDALTVDEANAHVNDDSRDDHPQYLNTTRHDSTARHPLGTVVATGTPGASAPGHTASEGVANSAARSDHRHEREDFGTVGQIGALSVGGAASAGSTGAVADAGHQHAMPGFAAPVAISYGSAGYVGDEPTLARSDHEHPMAAFYSAPSGSEPGDLATEGVSNSPARGDHVHGREYYPNLTQEVTTDISDVSCTIGNEVTLISDTIVVGTGGRLAHIDFRSVARRATVAGTSFAGNVTIKVDGVAVGPVGRYHSYGKDSNEDAATQTWTTLTAGSHTITVAGTVDPSANVDVYFYNRQITTALIGG